jgi:integrase
MASINKRNGKWQVRASYKDETGKFKTKSKGGFRTKREAELWSKTIEYDLSQGDLVDGSKLFADYFWDWFETYKESTVRDRTKLTYFQAHHVLKKYIPTLRLEDMNRRTYQKFIKDYGSTHSKSTVSKMSSLFHAAVKDGIYDGFIKKDFVAGTSLVFDKDRTRKISYLNQKELTTLVNYLCDTRNIYFTSKYMLITAFYTGMRPGEIGGLKWSDINFNFKTISIKQSWNETTKDFEQLKNDSSRRIIRVDDWLLSLLNELPKNDKLNRVFVNQYGTIPSSSAVNKTLTSALKELKINRPGYHFHSCRHTHVAYLLSKGIDLYAISKRLGHSDIAITSRVYAYMIDEYKAVTDDQIVSAIDLIKQDKPAVQNNLSQ